MGRNLSQARKSERSATGRCPRSSVERPSGHGAEAGRPRRAGERSLSEPRCPFDATQGTPSSVEGWGERRKRGALPVALSRMTMNLTAKHCVPCEGGVPPLTRAEAEDLLAHVPGWTLADDGKRISRAWKRADFRDAVAFLAAVADLAEAEGHHPDIHLTGYRRLRLDLTTHAIGGLSENDFILAAKVNTLSGA